MASRPPSFKVRFIALFSRARWVASGDRYSLACMAAMARVRPKSFLTKLLYLCDLIMLPGAKIVATARGWPLSDQLVPFPPEAGFGSLDRLEGVAWGMAGHLYGRACWLGRLVDIGGRMAVAKQG